ncbi:caspase-8-like [Rhinophrynus dorsalis]
MDFEVLLYDISQNLDKDDLCSMIFLCKDLISSTNMDRNDAKHLFQKLKEQGLLDKDNTFILKEVLYYIRRYDMLRDNLQIQKEAVEAEIRIPGRTKVSPYRHLLLDLAEQVTNNHLSQIKEQFHNNISPSKLEKVKSMLDLFTVMENECILSEDSLECLKSIFEKDESSLKIIIEYEESKARKNCFDQRKSDFQEPNLANSSQPQELFYEMKSRPRGICLIISNSDFGIARREIPELQELRDRRGTEHDEKSLRRVFTQLHFEIALKKDLKGDQILKTVQLYSEKVHEKRDCFICFILSHGDKGVIFGTDGRSVAIQDLTCCFTSSKCPSLAGKPKVFFIQACQGKDYHKAVQMESDASKASSGIGVKEDKLIPNEPDFLLGMATTLDHVSYRHPKTGTWYIQSLCKHLEEQCPRGEDINSILTRVNNDVSKKYDERNQGKQMPQPCTTLSKKLVFPLH